MKAKELMIEDWVNIMIVGYDNPVQIKEIGQFWVKVTQDDKDYGVILVQPILLTPEILEKNGFVKHDTWDEWVHYTNGVFIDFTLLVDEDGFYLDIPNARINYVHQLQHALKMCGIDKKIEL